MKDRVKRMLIGFGLMFGLQFIVAWAARAWFGVAGDARDIVGIPLIFTVAVYFGGGLVMGLLTEKMIWLEPLAVALLAIALNMFFYAIGMPDLTLISVAAFSSPSPILTSLVNFGSVVLAAIIGTLIGVRIKTPADDWVSNSAMIFGFLSLIIGPFLLLMASGRDQGHPGLPWYVVTIVMLLFLVVVGIGYVLFTREHHEAEEISISPDRRRTS